jgi:LysM repeat protein/DNA-directed RNA polymerase specialized sigma24 family protein
MKPQFDLPLELSSDLEWLLQNGKASRGALAEFLASEFYADALQLSWAVLGDLELARQTVVQAFSSAVVNQYRFRVGQNAQIWLFHFLIQAIKKAGGVQFTANGAQVEGQTVHGESLENFLQSLGEQDRCALFLSVFLGWQPGEIEELIGVEELRVAWLLNSARQRAGQGLPVGRFSHAALSLEKSLAGYFPRQPLTEEEQAEIATQLERAAEQKTARDLRRIRLAETFLTAIGVILVTGLILWLNQTLPAVSPRIAGLKPTARVIRVTRMVFVPVTATAGGTASLLTDYTVQPGDSLDSIAHLFGMTATDLMRLNGLSADARLRAGQSLKVLTSPHVRLRGAQSAAELPALPPPLNADSTPREVIQRLTSSQSFWSNIWVDAQLILNGPAGYIGPPDVTYEQAWVDNPGRRSIELSGKSSSHPEWAYAVSGSAGSQTDRSTSQRQDFLSNQLIKSAPLRAMIFPLNSDWLSSVESLVIGQVTPYIGREALLVSVMNASNYLQAQLWIDVETGVILRELRYSVDRSQIQTADFSITKISYNNDFPDGLFNPQDRLAVGFSEGASGLSSKLEDHLAPTENSQAHQPFAAGLAPPDFNTALAQLYFRYPESFDTEAASAVVNVLAGGYSLGEAQFGNPWSTICARSPDGQKIAYVGQPSIPQSVNAALHWFDLQNVNQEHLVSEDLAVDNFAFSSDGQKLAFFGRQAGQARGAVYIYDLQNGALQRLLDRNSANSLVWSPDGNFLAMTSDPTMLGSQDALVVDAHSGNIVAHDRYNWRGDFSLDPLSPDWPTFSWRSSKGTPVNFPVSMGGLEACVKPPL